jgi:hypothetical protein
LARDSDLDLPIDSPLESTHSENFTEDLEIQKTQRILKDSEDSEDLEDSEDKEGVPPELTRSVDFKQVLLDTSLPLRVFVSKASELSTDLALNANAKEWKSLTWEFVRLCKTHPELSGLLPMKLLK